jgi:hypothetical protein
VVQVPRRYQIPPLLERDCSSQARSKRRLRRTRRTADLYGLPGGCGHGPGFQIRTSALLPEHQPIEGLGKPPTQYLPRDAVALAPVDSRAAATGTCP